MLHLLDDALGSLVRSAVPGALDVRVDPPDASWARSGEADVVGLFLHRVVEDVDARAASWTDDVDDHGRVTARTAPRRRYRCCYLLTAWCGDRRAEHALLGAVLEALAAHVRVPDAHLPDLLRDPATPVELDVAHPALPSVTAETWSALGVAPRAHLDVVLTATATPARTSVAAPPAVVDLGVRRDADVPAPRRNTPPPPSRRIRE
ncbi:Pvc16 family protein [Umezawaea tangerina]|uniref:Pvc16 family protein n=1 Tax=Umezawaea tangerina TaxID=84725 RepID=UPI0014743F17|nr:Pvc16 family protein [Umezawaea tangerina]